MSTAKRVAVIVLVIVGIVAAVYAFEYLTVGIHALPAWVPGGHKGRRGHYHKYGAILAVVALACFASAGYIAYRARGKNGASGTDSSAPTSAPGAGTSGGDATSLLGGGDVPQAE
jgi:uncharacterized membrane protein